MVWVEARVKDRPLRLQAVMQIPGRAWLQFEVEPTEGGSRIIPTAIFDPLGLGGLLYWYGLYPIHWLIFRWMLSGVGARSGFANLTFEYPCEIGPSNLSGAFRGADSDGVTQVRIRPDTEN